MENAGKTPMTTINAWRFNHPKNILTGTGASKVNLDKAINLLRECEDMEQLAAVWKMNAAQWAREFNEDEAEQLIRLKDELKARLSMPGPSDLEGTCDELLQAYPDMGWQHHREKWGTLCSIPEWKDELRNLQMRFLENHERGGDCYSEFEALHRHWREGRTYLALQSDGKHHG
jgi:hypothetical protein